LALGKSDLIKLRWTWLKCIWGGSNWLDKR